MGLPKEMIYWLQLWNRLWSRNRNLRTKEFIVVNISKYKYCFNRSRNMSYDHFAQNLKIDKAGGGFKKRKSTIIIFSFTLINFHHFTFGMTVHCTSMKKIEQKHHVECPNLISNY